MAVSGCWGKKRRFLSGVAPDGLVAHSPANNLLPMFLQVTAAKPDASHIKDVKVGGLREEGVQ